MHCNTLIDPVCVVRHVLQSATGGVAGGILGGIAQAISDGIGWVVANTATWWIQIPSPNLGAEPAVAHIQQWLLPVTAAVAVAGVIGAGARMAILRRANPLLDVTGGMFALAAAVTLGTVVPALLLRAGTAGRHGFSRLPPAGISPSASPRSSAWAASRPRPWS